jgi:hypothetical protein
VTNLKTLNESFTDQEWAELQTEKAKSGKNWHDLILSAVLTFNQSDIVDLDEAKSE